MTVVQNLPHPNLTLSEVESPEPNAYSEKNDRTRASCMLPELQKQQQSTVTEPCEDATKQNIATLILPVVPEFGEKLEW